MSSGFTLHYHELAIMSLQLADSFNSGIEGMGCPYLRCLCLSWLKHFESKLKMTPCHHDATTWKRFPHCCPFMWRRTIDEELGCYICFKLKMKCLTYFVMALCRHCSHEQVRLIFFCVDYLLHALSELWQQFEHKCIFQTSLRMWYLEFFSLNESELSSTQPH